MDNEEDPNASRPALMKKTAAIRQTIRPDTARKADQETSIAMLDLLRALAAFTVVAGHTRTVFFIPWNVLPHEEHQLLAALFYAIARVGPIAVLIFFVLSGYLVGGPLIARTSTGTLDIKSYFIARASRIFTPLIPAVCFAALVGYFTTAVAEDPAKLLASAFALNDILAPTTRLDPPLWSISFEVWFYILAGSFAAVILRRHLAWALLGTLLGAIVFTRLPAVFMFFWGFGALAYHCRASLDGRWALLVGLVIWVGGVGLFEVLKPDGEVVNQDVVVWAQGLACAGFALCLPAFASARCNAVLAPLQRAAAKAASFSYSLYLFHYPFLLVLAHWIVPMRRVTAQTLAAYLAILFVTVFAGWLSYLLFERQTPHVRAWLHMRFGKAGDHSRANPRAPNLMRK